MERHEFIALILTTRDEPFLKFSELAASERDAYLKKARRMLQHIARESPSALDSLWQRFLGVGATEMNDSLSGVVAAQRRLAGLGEPDDSATMLALARSREALESMCNKRFG
jgi:hypothetical protein